MMGQRRNVLVPQRSTLHMWGSELRAWRDQRGLSLAELGRRIHYDGSHLGKFERGERVPPHHVVMACDRALDTGGELGRLYTLVIATEPATEQAVPAKRYGGASHPGFLNDHPPAQLPTDIAGFAGRTPQLRQLDAVLRTVGTQSSPVAIAAVSGPAGVGKTALAVHWAHRVAKRFPDGQLYVNLRGYGPSHDMKSPSEAVRGFLEALHATPESVPTDPDAQAATYRSLLSGRHVLVVLDNARDSDHVRPLLPGSPGCLVVVTSRAQLSTLVADGAHAVSLDPFAGTEAREFMDNRIGKDRVSVEPEAVEEIITACARLPLALAVVSARATVHPGFSLRALAAELRRARALDAFDGTEPTSDIRSVFSWSYRLLSPHAARLFRLLGLHAGPDITTSAAASLAAIDLQQASRALTRLAYAHLVTEHAPGRYSFHDLLRAYASELALVHESRADRVAALRRIVEHYLHSAFRAAMLLHPQREPIDLSSPQAGVTPEPFADHHQALGWYAEVRHVLLAALQQAAEEELDSHAWQLAWTLAEFLDLQGHWHDMVIAHSTALAVAQRQANSWQQAESHRSLGNAYLRLRLPDEASNHFRSALALSRRIADTFGGASSYLGLARVAEQHAQPSEALGYARQAYSLLLCTDQHRTQVEVLNRIGWYHTLLGEYQHALRACQKALLLLNEIDYRYGQAATHDSLGYIYFHLADHGRAIACYNQALSIFREVRDSYLDADILTRLGDAYHANHDWKGARDAWQRALDILQSLRHTDVVIISAKLDTLTTESEANKES